MDMRTISNVCLQLENVCKEIGSLALGIHEQNDSRIRAAYEELLLDEVRHAQILTLELTKLAAGDGRADGGSMFGESELNSTLAGEDDGDEED